MNDKISKLKQEFLINNLSQIVFFIDRQQKKYRTLLVLEWENIVSEKEPILHEYYDNGTLKGQTMYLDVFIGYYKQGDDLNAFLVGAENPQEGLNQYVEFLENCVERAKILRDNFKGEEIQADTHHIGFYVDDERGQDLLKWDIYHRYQDEEEFDDDIWDCVEGCGGCGSCDDEGC